MEMTFFCEAAKNMKSFVWSVLFFLVFLPVLSAQQLPSVTIVNNTGYEIWYVHISETTAGSWGADRLGDSNTLADGDSIALQLPYPLETVNHYDMKLEDLDGDTYTKMNVLVTANSRIEFTLDDYDDNNISFEYTGPPITIVNNTGYDIWYIYISDSQSDSWGLDRLGRDETLATGESISLNLPYPIETVKRYDIKLMDLDGDTYTKMNVLVVANRSIEFTLNDIDIDDE